MRASRKKLLRLEEKRLYHNHRDAYEDEYDGERKERRKPRYKQSSDEVFKCKHCRRFVCPPPSGGRHRNHCPFCLYSRHVDDRKPGDRMSPCGALMEPGGYFQRPNGEYVIVHYCFGCGLERFNRIAADDDFDLVVSLPAQRPRTSREAKAGRVEAWLDEQVGLWDLDAEEAG